jgi:outer membrane immunogenic protein
MKKLLVGGIAFASFLSGPLMAADMPLKAPPLLQPVVYNWSGCYVGGNVGNGWSRRNADSAVPLISDQAPSSVTLNGSGAVGGGQLGCNYQFSSYWVAGIEGDYMGTGLNDTRFSPNLSRAGVPFANGGITFSASTKSLSSVRGRLGFTVWPNMLLYATGGAAWVDTNFGGSDVFLGGCAVGNCATTAFSSTTSGWVAGVGGEWAPWNNNWLVRLEYLHYGFDGTSATPFRPSFPAAPPTFTWHSQDVDVVRAGLSFKFW